MPTVKRIVCLANSRKLSGRCVAGIEIPHSARPTARPSRIRWIRPVSDRPTEEVSEYERQYRDGSDPKVLDIVRVPLVARKARGYQSENWLLDSTKYWTKEGQFNNHDLLPFIQNEECLWINGYSTIPGQHDKVPLSLTGKLSDLLRLVLASDLTLRVIETGCFYGNPKRRVQGRFTLSSIDYRLWVTDPTYEREFLQRPAGVAHRLDRCFVTVSLSEPFQGSCFKLIAAIIECVSPGQNV